MTSTNDGKDVKSIQTSGQKGKTYYIELYKSLDTRLSGECSGEDRTRLVCEAWRLVHSLCQHSTPSTQTHLILWLQQHTSHTLLQTEWQAPASKEQHTWLKDAINAFVAECRDGASKREGLNLFWETQLLNRAEWFLNVLPNPWGHQVLKALLDPNGKQPSDDEVLEWLKEERGLMFVTRLRQLASSRRCDDLALLLATAVMTRVRFTTKIVPDVVQAQEPK
ncbi:jg20603, partial [Pararge aegeria aegeria]